MVDRYRGMSPRRGNERNMSVSRSCMNNTVKCPDSVSGDCKAMLRRLQTVDFSIYDTVLYLDIYPECAEALAYYNKLLEEREALRRSLSQKCKRPMTSFENSSAEAWDWISSPWPWDLSAN